jgi:Ca2+-transporting ATPase
LLITLAIYGFTLQQGRSEHEARALTFTTLVLANLGLIYANRYWSRTMVASLLQKNTALLLITSATIVFLGMVLYVPLLRGLFAFGVLHANDILVCILAAIVSISWFEAVKHFGRGRVGA